MSTPGELNVIKFTTTNNIAPALAQTKVLTGAIQGIGEQWKKQTAGLNNQLAKPAKTVGELARNFHLLRKVMNDTRLSGDVTTKSLGDMATAAKSGNAQFQKMGKIQRDLKLQFLAILIM
jgi:hypothetical protein